MWFCKEQQNKHEIAMYTQIVVVIIAVAVKVWLLTSLKSDKPQNDEQPNEHKTSEAQPNKKKA